jgi:LmbE family N-acetylglucosaminyl deacetylase
VPFTLVSFHAHPDDEALLTGGTLARAAADGHRVVLVTATAGEAGLSGDGRRGRACLAERRRRELEQSARALGCARWEILGYTDSGSEPHEPAAPGTVHSDQGAVGPPFARLDPQGPAERLAEILRAESADVLTVYDAQGGYGHPDHVQVHRVGVLAAQLAGTPVVLEATVDRRLLVRVAAVMRWIPGVARLVPASRFASAYLPREELTHRVDVRRHLAAKRAALAAHHSQTTGGGSVRTLTLLLRLPGPVLGLALGREWFRERGTRVPTTPLDDVFASLR